MNILIKPAIRYFDKGNLKEALKLLRRAVLEYPNDLDAHYMLAHTLRSQKNYKEALEHYRFVYDSEPLQLKTLRWVVQMYREMEDYIGESQVLLEALDKTGSSNDKDAVRGWLAAKQKDYDAAYEHLIKAANSNSALLRDVGLVLRLGGRLEEAQDVLEQAIDQLPDFAPMFYELGLVQERLGKISEAETYFARALHISPTYYEFALLGLARVVRKQKWFRRWSMAKYACIAIVKLHTCPYER